MIPTTSTPKTAIQTWAKCEAQAYYQDDHKAELASTAVGHGIDCMRMIPVGWNVNNTSEDFSSRLHSRIKAKMKADASVKPVGFIFALPGLGWLFWTMVSGIISWAVERILDIYYPTKVDK